MTGTYEGLLVSGSDGLDLLLEHREVGIGRTQFRPKVPSSRSLSAHTVLLLLTVLVLLSIWVSCLRLLTVWLGSAILVVVALSWCGANILLRVGVRAPGWGDHAVRWGWVRGLLRSRLVTKAVSEVQQRWVIGAHP